MAQSRVGILGGGIAGLACAYYLARAGHQPVIMESSSRLGGLDPQIDHHGVRIDRTPHSISHLDTAVCGLLADLGALGRLTWRPTTSGILFGDRVHPLTRPSDTLRMHGMSLADRLRSGVGLLHATRLKGYTLHLNEVLAIDWLPRVFGRRLFERYWRPYLELCFGDAADHVPAYPVWRDLKRIYDQRRRVGGYIKGGPRWLVDQLRRRIEDAGGEVRLNVILGGVEASGTGCSVEIDGAEHGFDAVISTLAPSALSKLARGRLTGVAGSANVHSRGDVIALAVMTRRLSSYHSTIVADDSVPFRSIQESTRVIPSRQCGGKHLVYLTNTCETNGDGYTVADDVIRKQVIESLAKCYRDFDPGALEAVYLTRREDAEPIFTVDNLRHRPGIRTQGVRFYLCTPAQAYPRALGWDAEITLAREVAGSV